MTAHECYPEEISKDGIREVVFHGPSPDELTIVDFAFRRGFEIQYVSDEYVQVWKTAHSGFMASQKQRLAELSKPGLSMQGDHMPPKEEDLETNDKFTEMEMEEGSG